jgi:uncharacterized protein (TIGR03435 family)
MFRAAVSNRSMEIRVRLTTLVCAAIAAGTLAIIGTATAQPAAFDVASVRPNTSDATPELRAMPGGRLIATNVPLRLLIRQAFKLHDAQIIGAADWTSTERFDIDARTAAPPAGGPNAVMPLLQPLLRDRFALRAHMEMRELPAYVLVLAHRDGRMGPQLRKTESDCGHPTTLSQQEIRASVRDSWPPCGMTFTVSFVASGASGTETTQLRIRRSGITMADFADALQERLDRPIVDGTGLEGRFDVEYTYGIRPPTVGADSPFGAPPPLLFAAVEEQLGLKLESRRANVPVLIVEAVDRPTEN